MGQVSGQAASLRLQGVSVFLEKTVIFDVTFCVYPGHLCVLLGPNGAGKTTLMRALDGLLPLAKGDVFVAGRDMKALSRRELSRRVAYVPQLHQGVFSYSVEDFVVMGRAPHLPLFGSPGKEDREMVHSILDSLNIIHLAKRDYLQLSGGERQLVLLARGLIQEPEILLLDEPTAHLDFSHKYKIMDTVRGLVREKNLCALVSLHDPNLALEFGDQVLVLDEGTVKADLRRNEEGFLRNLEKALQEVFGDGIGIAETGGKAVVLRR